MPRHKKGAETLKLYNQVGWRMAEFTPLDGAGTGSSAARRSPAARGREPEVSETTEV